MAITKKAFGMTFEEFSAFFEDSGGFSTPPNKNHQYINDGETLLDFVSDGCNDLISEDSEAIGILK